MKKNPLKRIARALTDALARLAPPQPQPQAAAAAQLPNHVGQTPSQYKYYVTNGKPFSDEMKDAFKVQRCNQGEPLKVELPEDYKDYFEPVFKLIPNNNNNNNNNNHYEENLSSSESSFSFEDCSGYSTDSPRNKPF